MSNSHRTLDDLLAISRACRYCGAEEGAWCIVAKGKTAGRTTPWLHADRLWVSERAHSTGYTSGRAAALDEIRLEIRHRGERWSDLPQHANAAEILFLIEKRLETAKTWVSDSMDHALAEIPEEWRRG